MSTSSMKTSINGIIPVMLMPFHADGQLDSAGLSRLTEWYLAHGAQALFAVCQSSEMRYLSVDERVALAKQVVQDTAGRIPVVASGHVADTLAEQIAELQAIAATGIDALVLVTNRIDVHNAGTAAFLHHLDALLAALPTELPLGLYECPAPYRRLLSDEELQYCIDSGRFV
ncbi:MAG: dihydrodipicolinate synthase family protein, partial [Thiolinea sp.]